jgi:hypothetical protein
VKETTMMFKVLVVLSAFFVLVGAYNLTWKRRPIPGSFSAELGGLVLSTRRPALGWLCFFASFAFAVAAFFVYH